MHNIIDHDIRNKAKLSMLEYCILDTIYNLSTSGKETYKTWCNMSKTKFTHLSCVRSITYTFNNLEKRGYLEFYDEKRFLKRTTKKYYNEIRTEILKVQKLHGARVAPVQDLHPNGAEVAPVPVQDLHPNGAEVAPNNNKDNNKDKDIDKVGKEPPLSGIKILSNLDKKKEKKEEPKSCAKKVTKGDHVFPDITSPRNYDSLSHLDRRTNKQLPFDVVSASETMNLLFPQKKDARKEYNSIYSEKASLEVIEKSWKTFIEKRFSNSFQEIRGVSILKKIFFEWTQKQVKFEKSNGFSFKKSNFRNNGVSVENELIDYDEQRDAKLREESRNQ